MTVKLKLVCLLKYGLILSLNTNTTQSVYVTAKVVTRYLLLLL